VAVNGKQRYAVNNVSYVSPDTPLKVTDYYKIGGVFSMGTIADSPTYDDAYLQTSVMGAATDRTTRAAALSIPATSEQIARPQKRLLPARKTCGC
jgi:hypothetical protein